MKNKKHIILILLFMLYLIVVYTPTKNNILVNDKDYGISNNELMNTISVDDLKNGMFTVNIMNISSNVNNIKVPVWTVTNGQDDIIWYDAKKQSDGNYKAFIYLKDHNMEMGEYCIHVYLYHNNEFVGIKGASKNISQVYSGDLQTTVLNNNDQVTIELSNSDYLYDKIQFAVWSTANGQDDLIWYDAKRVGDTLTYTVPMKNHNAFGSYIVHVYAFNSNGKGKILSAGSFKIDAPPVEYSSFDYNPDTNAIDVKIKFNTSINITMVQIPIWSTANGQDDTIWYNAIKEDDGTWNVHTNLSNHNYFVGNYSAHFYITTSSGMNSIVYALSKEIIPTDRVTAYVNHDKTGFNINYSNYYKLKGYTIMYAVWSDANGQDDTIWYSATNGKVSGSFSDHLNKNGNPDSGKYNVHFYICKNGVLYFMDAISFEVDTPKATIVEANQSGDTIEVYVKNVSSKVKSIEIPTWSIINGQDDIYWYIPTNLGNGTWHLVIKLKNHNYNDGNYAIHTYLRYDNKTQLIGSSCNVSINKGIISANVNTTETTARVTLTDSFYNSGNIKFAVWSVENGQDDLIWYTAKKTLNTSYYDIPIKNHKTAGKYNVHVYNDYGIIMATSFEISPVDFNVNISDIDISDIDGDGIYKVTVSEINSKSGISKVEIPVWSASNQSDIYWYNAVKEGDCYVAYINPRYHRYNSGNYHTHIYVTGNNGISGFAAKENIKINLQINAKVISTHKANTIVQVYNTSPSIKKVQLPTWSIANGQDDTIWYEGIRQSDGSYYITIQASNHPPFDQNLQSQLVSHLYVDGNLITALSLTVNKYLLEPRRYSQKDPRWGNFIYGFKNLSSSGCMPTAIAMVISGILDRDIYPNEIANYLYYNTDQFNRAFYGSGGLSVYYAAQHYGVSYKRLLSSQMVKEALDNGQLVIGAVRNGVLNLVNPGYTHAVVLYGYNKADGKTTLVDPLDGRRNGSYRVDDLFNEHSYESEDLNSGGAAFHSLY